MPLQPLIDAHASKSRITYPICRQLLHQSVSRNTTYAVSLIKCKSPSIEFVCAMLLAVVQLSPTSHQHAGQFKNLNSDSYLTSYIEYILDGPLHHTHSHAREPFFLCTSEVNARISREFRRKIGLEENIFKTFLSFFYLQWARWVFFICAHGLRLTIVAASQTISGMDLCTHKSRTFLI